MRKLIVEFNSNVRKGIYYKIVYPELLDVKSQFGILEGVTIYDSYIKKHFPEKATVINKNLVVGNRTYEDFIKTLELKEISYRQRFNKVNNGVRVVMDITNIVNDPIRLCDENGRFVSSCPGGDGVGYSIGYLEELCEWVYNYANLSKKDMLKNILDIEGITREKLKSMGIGFVPTWSKKLTNS